MIENSMFYMDFEISSEQQRECIENNRIAGFRCEYFIKNRVKKHFS